MPAELRQEYEALTAESLVFYLRNWVAESGTDFDRLVEKYGLQPLPWSAKLDSEAFHFCVLWISSTVRPNSFTEGRSSSHQLGINAAIAVGTWHTVRS